MRTIASEKSFPESFEICTLWSPTFAMVPSIVSPDSFLTEIRLPTFTRKFSLMPKNGLNSRYSSAIAGPWDSISPAMMIIAPRIILRSCMLVPSSCSVVCIYRYSPPVRIILSHEKRYVPVTAGSVILQQQGKPCGRGRSRSMYGHPQERSSGLPP